MHRPVMPQMVNWAQSPVNEYTIPVIGSPEGKNGHSIIDQDIVKEKRSGFYR